LLKGKDHSLQKDRMQPPVPRASLPQETESTKRARRVKGGNNLKNKEKRTGEKRDDKKKRRCHGEKKRGKIITR